MKHVEFSSQLYINVVFKSGYFALSKLKKIACY